MNKSDLARALSALRKTHAGPAKVMRPCPKCAMELSAREMRAHKCDAAKPSKPKKQRA
jgi:hypothetical protein